MIDTESTTATEDLVKIVQQMHEAMKTVASNQEKLLAEQERMGKAIGETGIILQDHAQKIRNTGAAVVRLWNEAGLPVAEATAPLN
jgi:hypothetical protein